MSEGGKFNWTGAFLPTFNFGKRRTQETSFLYSHSNKTFDIPNLKALGYVDFAKRVNAIDSAIIYLADLFKGCVIYAVDEKGDIVENDPLVSKLLEPNHLQGKEEFLAEFYYYLTAAGWCYLLPYNKAAGFEKNVEDDDTKLFVLNPDFCNFSKIETNIFDLESLDFEYNFKNSSKKYSKDLDTSRIIPFWDSIADSSNPYIGHSRLSSLFDESQNTMLADRGKHNQILRTGGMVISHKEKGKDGFSDGLDEVVKTDKKTKKITTQKDIIEDRLNKLGLAQGQNILVSSKELTGFSLSKDIIGIDFDKMKESDIIVISNKIGVPPELMPLSGNNAKYENRLEAQYQVFQNRIVPVAQNIATALPKYYKSKNKLVFSYDHTPAYQHMAAVKEDSKNKIVERTEKLLTMGLIDNKQAIQTLTNCGIL